MLSGLGAGVASGAFSGFEGEIATGGSAGARWTGTDCRGAGATAGLGGALMSMTGLGEGGVCGCIVLQLYHARKR